VDRVITPVEHKINRNIFVAEINKMNAKCNVFMMWNFCICIGLPELLGYSYLGDYERLGVSLGWERQKMHIRYNFGGGKNVEGFHLGERSYGRMMMSCHRVIIDGVWTGNWIYLTLTDP
jgi:hypothetical protein